MDESEKTVDINLQQLEDDEYDDLFFLQPASSPYDIKAKIKHANEALSNLSCSDTKEPKVKFKDDLICFEPESTFTEISSIASDENTENTVIEDCITSENETAILEAHLQTNLTLEDENTNTEEEIPEEVIENKEDRLEKEFKLEKQLTISSKEEINYNTEEYLNNFCLFEENEEVFENEVNICCVKSNLEQQNIYESETEDELVTYDIYEDTIENSYVVGSSSSSHDDSYEDSPKKIDIEKPKETKQKKYKLPKYINCKRHCIDKFDSDDDKKVQPIQRPLWCPVLRLQKRNCCEKNEFKKQQKLPQYTGLRSEYGLSAEEIKETRKKKARLKRQKAEEERLLEETRRRKIEENEKIFLKWLKDVSNRPRNNQHQREKNQFSERSRKRTSSIVGTIRPNTAPGNRQLKIMKRPQRPHTSPASICIQIPRKLLKNGITIGDLKISTHRTASENSYHTMKIY